MNVIASERSERSNLVIFLFVLFFFLFSSSIKADTITLKNGDKFKGAVLKETRDEVEAIVDAGILRFRRADVASIKKGSVWENSAYLKKAQEYGYGSAPVTPKKSKVKAVQAEEPSEEPAAESSSDLALREKELELRRQEMELKRTELEIQREELKLKREAFDRPVETRSPGVIVETIPAERGVKPAPPTPEEIEEETAEFEEEPAVTAEEDILKKKVTEEEARQIAIEEQQKEQERKDRVESQRRLQEIRQKQEGVTIRGKVHPAGGERYDTY